eukprot:SAG31_NODE_4624_length_3089_cov_3.616722_1_plen_262_part_00
MAGLVLTVGCICAAAAMASAAGTPPANWPAPTKGLPVYWFGTNLKAFDTADYLANLTSRFDLAIYGATHASLTPPRYQQASQKLSTQCARLKAVTNTTRCAVYRQGWLAMSNYDEEMAVMNATDTTDWFLKDDTGQQWGRPWCIPGPKSKCAVQGLYWNFANASAAAYYQEKVIKPITLDPAVDAVFFVSAMAIHLRAPRAARIWCVAFQRLALIYGLVNRTTCPACAVTASTRCRPITRPRKPRPCVTRRSTTSMRSPGS